jgi:hypothetical protein
MTLQRLTDTDLTITPIDPQFLAIASETLGNFGESTDGFDEIMLIPTGALTGDINSLDDLGQDLLDMDFIEGEFAGNAWKPVGDAMQPFTDTGDTIIGAFNDAVTPPDTSGGGGNGGGGGGGGNGGGGGGGGNGGGGGDTGGGGSGGGGGLKCTVISNPVTHEVIGTSCDDGGVPVGGGVHTPLQQ